MTGRAKALYEKARKGLSGPVDNALLEAMAIMIDAALPEPKTKNGTGQDRVAGLQVYERLKKEAPTAVIYTPTADGTKTAAGKLARAANLTEADITALALWLNKGGLSWMREKPTYQYIARNIVDLVARAKGALPYEALEPDALDRLRQQGDL